jgi:hypothetical protein
MMTHTQRTKLPEVQVHSWFEFAPGQVDWSSYANYWPGNDTNVNKALALAVVRKLVIQCYGVADGGEHQRKQCVAKVMVVAKLS